MKIKRFAMLLLTAAILTAMCAVTCAAAESGTWGDNLTWTLEGGKLTISGTGEMGECQNAPWRNYLADITSAEIGSGVTTIGDSAFNGCVNLESVTIRGNVTRIEGGAFMGCALQSITLPQSLTSIGNSAFVANPFLTGIVIPGNVTTLGSDVFAYCYSLKTIVMPAGVTSIGDGAVEGCDSLTVETPCTSVYVPQWAAANNIPCRQTHSLQGTAAAKATCTAAGNSAYWSCGTCGQYFSDQAGTIGITKDSWVIPALGHKWGSPTYAWAKDNSAVTAKRVCSRDGSHVQSEKVATTYKVTKKATYTATGVGTYTTKAFKNTAFKTQTKKVTLDKLARTPISKAKVTAIADQVYTGSAIKPALTIKYSGKKLVKGTDYTVSFKNNVKPGQATVTITGIKAYKGTVTATFKILPKPVKLLSLAPEKKKVAVMWKKGAAITGYDIEYSMNKDFSKSYTISISSALRITAKIGNLKPGKTYYVRIRTYKKVGSKVYYSTWSDSMKAKVPAE